MKKLFAAFFILLFSHTVSNASTVTYLTDIPTHNILDYGSYDMQFRVFNEGGVLTKLNFGVFQSLNVGVSWELANLIGNDTVNVAIPALQLKLNIYDGNMTYPGIAIGYDGQGYFYDKEESEFTQKGRGVYIVAGKEFFLPSLNFNLGLNNDFSETPILGFLGASFLIVDETLMIMTEYDNIGKGGDARLNSGLRLWITENFDLDFIVRDMLTTKEGSFGCERIFKLSYQSRF